MHCCKTRVLTLKGTYTKSKTDLELSVHFEVMTINRQLFAEAHSITTSDGILKLLQSEILKFESYLLLYVLTHLRKVK